MSCTEMINMKNILIMGIIMGVTTINNIYGSEKLITHKQNESFFDLSKFKNTLNNKENLSMPLNEEMELLEQLSQFELGRFLLLNKGLNGYWTAYIILHGLKQQNLPPLETWVLRHAPTVKAAQERFRVFQKVLQEKLKDNTIIASVPCGLMDDLLTLDYSNKHNIRLVGIDLDKKSLDLAQEQSKRINISNIDFIQSDAWKLKNNEEFDIITSNGLNIYEPDDEKVIALYRQFHQALKPKGILITSFLTPPPSLSKESPWRNVNQQDALKQKVIFSDIIGVTWQAFRTEEKTRKQLERAGFEVLEVIYDSQGIFPAVVARKS